MKTHREQFIECSATGLCNETEFKSFADYPDLRPAFASLRLREAMLAGHFSGVTLIKCGRFNNSICSSGNVECKKFRAVLADSPREEVA